MAAGAGISATFSSGPGAGWPRRGTGAGAGYETTTSTPLTILGSSLKGWWDFSDASSLFQLSNGTTAVSADADPIGYVTDKSGTGTHVIQASANLRGTYKTGIKNGRAVCRFDGINDMLGATLVQSQPFTAFVVFKYASNGVLFGAMMGKNNTECAIVYNNGTKFRMFAGTERDVSAEDTNWHIASVTYNGASSTARLDATDKTLAGTPGAQTLTKVAFGDYFDAGGQGPVDIGEAMIATGSVSAGNIASIESYLNSRWAVY